MGHSVSPYGDPTKLLGATFVVQTRHEAFTGELFCYDVGPAQKVVIMKKKNEGYADFDILLLNSVCQVSVKSGSAPSPSPRLESLDQSLLEKREQLALEVFERERHSRGVGVTRKQQDLFERLQKCFLKVEWKDKNVVLFGGEVQLVPPYDETCVEGGSTDLRNRICHVLKEIASEEAGAKQQRE